MLDSLEDRVIGQKVGHYRILEKLGGGGMGVVYRAEDLKLGRAAALMFLPPELVRDEEAKQRFLHEARAAAALDHPNICTIYESGETAEGDVFIAMALYEGQTLKRRLESGPLPFAEAAGIARQVADGLACAHRQKIIHRDIKPANLMLTTGGPVKILDFGLAKLTGATALTRTGETLGTVAYMSPEQARGAATDYRSDLWSLGAVLYEMVAGRPPFPGEYPHAVIYAILNEEPQPLSTLRPNVPPELERVILRALAKTPAQRHESAEALAEVLRRQAPATGLSGGVMEAGSGDSHPAASPSGEVTRFVPTPGVLLEPPLETAKAPPVSLEEKVRRRGPWWLYAAAAPFLCYAVFALCLQFIGLERPQWSFRNLADGWHLEELQPADAASRAGMQPGDRLVAIDGHAVTGVSLGRFLRFAEPGRAYRIDVDRRGERRRCTLTFEHVPWRYWGTQSGLIDLENILISLILTVLAFAVAFLRPNDPLARLGALWMATWGIPFSWMISGLGPGYARVLSQLPIPLAVLILMAPILAIGISPELTLIFFASFPRKLFRAGWVYPLLWACTLPRLSIMGYQFFNNDLGDGTFTVWPGVLKAFASIRSVYWLLSIGILVWNYRTLEDPNERRRMRLLVTGLGLFMGFTSIHGLCSVKIWDLQMPLIAFYWSSPLPLVVSFLIAVAAMLVAVAILKHRLFGVRMTIRRVLQYAAARGLLLALAPLCAGLLVLNLLLHADQPLSAILAGRGWFYIVLGLAGVSAHTGRRKWLAALDRRFFREHYDAQRTLADVVGEIRQAPSLEAVAPSVAGRIEAALHPEFAALLARPRGAPEYRVLAAAGACTLQAMPAGGKLAAVLRVLEKPIEITQSTGNWLWRQLPDEETDWLRQARLEWLFPVVVSADGPEMLLAVGPKRSEEPFSEEDRSLLEAITAALALKVESVSARAAGVEHRMPIPRTTA